MSPLWGSQERGPCFLVWLLEEAVSTVSSDHICYSCLWLWYYVSRCPRWDLECFNPSSYICHSCPLVAKSLPITARFVSLPLPSSYHAAFRSIICWYRWVQPRRCCNSERGRGNWIPCITTGRRKKLLEIAGSIQIKSLPPAMETQVASGSHDLIDGALLSYAGSTLPVETCYQSHIFSFAKSLEQSTTNQIFQNATAHHRIMDFLFLKEAVERRNGWWVQKTRNWKHHQQTKKGQKGTWMTMLRKWDRVAKKKKRRKENEIMIVATHRFLLETWASRVKAV